MKIAVCGDDRNTREQIASLIREQEPDAEIVNFEARETMIKTQENFAVSFLDVEMKEISGLVVANGTIILIYDTVPATLFLIPVIRIMLLGTVIANAMLFFRMWCSIMKETESVPCWKIRYSRCMKRNLRNDLKR